MKKFERIVGLIAIFGILLKIFHIPGGNMLTVLSLMTLSIFYFLFSFVLFNDIKLTNISKKETSEKRRIGAVGLGLAISIIINGGLFKLQFWPKADMQLLVGLVAIGVVLFVAIIFYFRNKPNNYTQISHFQNKPDEYYKRIFTRIVIYGGLGLVLYCTPSTILVDVYYRNNPDYAEMFKKVLANPDNLELREQFDEIRKQK
ncbi:MAG: hypothetical protein FWC39_06370 [Bacteroidetes bacterium]|nr:hypothetical protein [Bacteroidota bacterium]